MGEEDSEPKRSRGLCGWFIALLVLGAIAAAIAVAVKVKRDHHHSAPKLGPVPGPPGPVVKMYGDALTLQCSSFKYSNECSVRHYHYVNILLRKLIVDSYWYFGLAAGKLVNNTISWRGDSALQDGSEAHIVMGILEYGDQMQTVNQLNPAQDSLKWITDYLINAHSSADVLYIQVGDPVVDHKCWDRPEDMTEERPLTQVNTSSPGSDVAGETAAAMAAASLVFKSINSTYSSLLLEHAQELFTFADGYRGLYSESIPEVQAYYNSTSYGDDLLWAASWLYFATGNQSYFDYVTGKNGVAFANWGNPSWFTWDNKLAGTQVLLSRVSFFGGQGSSNSGNLQKYMKTAEAVMCGVLPKSPTATSSRTDSKLIS
ncbi:hypothetical protein C3L33_09465, partial [Rhododendron williamsianum]